jgi:hypothetical protein
MNNPTLTTWTTDEKLTKLNELNAHLAGGGTLAYMDAAALTPPHWGSDLENWSIVHLPRKAVIRVAYRFNIEGSIYHVFIREDEVKAYQDIGGWQVKEIEVEETP